MMSELSRTAPRRRRADAERSRAAILDAAIRVLNEHPEASVEEIARAAGVTRQTVYAHFASREVLLRAVMDRATAESVAMVEAANLEEGSPAAALARLLRASWQFMARYPFLLHGAPVELHPNDNWHEPILDPLERLIRRGQETGDFDRRLSSSWLLAAMIALGEAAGAEVSAGRMSIEDAARALERSTLRVFGVEDASVSDPVS